MRLSERLARVASYVIPGAVVADIGTDHALLPVYLVLQGISKRVIACELNPGPLESARATVDHYGLKELVEVRKGNGLQALRPGEASVVVIAGMGGAKIREILTASPEVLRMVKRLILQPQGGEALLRRWLLENKWALIDEELVYEGGRFYVIIVSELLREGECQDFENSLLEIGPKLLEKRHPLLVPYLNRLIQGYEDVIMSLGNSSGSGALAVLREFQEKLFFLRRMIRCLSNAGPS